ncbi:FAD:protein FMN transferase [Rhodobacteraceae bacterium CCMM004]|nr:FAD:protein FMN transferase [Rhodobacteraceae bacterium CCMM004]
MLSLSRRRFLTVSAAACGLAAGGAHAAPPSARWRGTAMGAAASLHLVGLAAEAAAPILTDVAREVRRLEDIFSLYRPGSEIARLNAAGRLARPAPDLLAVLSLAGHLNAATGGAFDPTVQPLFAVAARAAADGCAPEAEAVAAARAVVGWDGVAFDADAVRLDRPGAALTLNGIAQGYVTDRIAALLRARGLTDILVDMGEIAARGHRPDGHAWQAGIADPEGALLKRLRLADRALATSAPLGTVLDPEGRIGHIFDPAAGVQAAALRLVSVSAPEAALADGLSTALCVLPAARHAAVLRRFPDTRIELAV